MISLKPPNQQTLQDEPIKETIVNDPFVMKKTEFNSYGVIKTSPLKVSLNTTFHNQNYSYKTHRT